MCFFTVSLFINILRSENPITLTNDSEPEPDYVIAKLRSDNYLSGHPGAEDILLLIEVADNSLDWDRSNKLFIYASAGIQEYWIINLVDRQLEQHLGPKPEDGSYQRGLVHSQGAVFNSNLLNDIDVAELLP